MKNVRKFKDRLFYYICSSVAYFSVALLLILFIDILIQAWPWLDLQFLQSFPSRKAAKAGVKAAMYGSVWLISFTILFSVPLGIATAFYMEEYAPKNWFTRFLQINLNNLAAMPSIVYGLLGLSLFVRTLGLGQSILAGALLMSLLILPVIVIASQEAIRAVPVAIRYAAFALGARRWQVIFGQILPAALPGIMTGIILAISRAMGESAPLIMVGALSYVAFVPQGVMDAFTVMPVQIYAWAGKPQEEFQGIAAAGIVVLLSLLLSLNALAIYIRLKFQRYKS